MEKKTNNNLQKVAMATLAIIVVGMGITIITFLFFCQNNPEGPENVAPAPVPEIEEPKEGNESNESEEIFCTMDAKQCPDGSFVGRDSKNDCEFNPCPGENNSEKEIDTSDWQTYRNEKYGFELKYPKEWKINKDDEYMTIEINGNLFGAIEIESKESFNSSFEKCLETEDHSTCEHTHYGMDFEAFSKQYEIVDFLAKQNMSKNIDSGNYLEFEIGCSAIGGHKVIKNIINRDASLNMVRTIGFCGYDSHFSNYYYFATFFSENRMFMIKFDLFPGDTNIYEWMSENITNNNASLDDFDENFHLNLLNDTIAEPIKNQIEVYDNLISSFRIAR